MGQRLGDHPQLRLGAGVSGRGVRARRALPRGWIVHRLSGLPLSAPEYVQLHPLKRRRCTQVAAAVYRGPSGEFDDWFNHSCRPNLDVREVDGELLLVTNRDLRADEELTWDYASVVTDRFSRFRCRCGEAACRQIIQRFADCPMQARAALARRRGVPGYQERSPYIAILGRRARRSSASIPDGLRVGASRIAGMGLFATQQFGVGARVCTLEGEEHRFISRTAGDAAAFANWIAVGRDRWIETEGACRYLNHSCEPNVRIRGDRAVMAIRDISCGDEITLDYSLTTSERYWSMRCSCGTPHCTGVVRAAK